MGRHEPLRGLRQRELGPAVVEPRPPHAHGGQGSDVSEEHACERDGQVCSQPPRAGGAPQRPRTHHQVPGHLLHLDAPHRLCALLLRERPRAVSGQQGAEHRAQRLLCHERRGAETGQVLDHRGQDRHRHVRGPGRRHRVVHVGPLHCAGGAHQQAIPDEPVLGGDDNDAVRLRRPDALHPVRGRLPPLRHGHRRIHVLIHCRQRLTAHRRAPGPIRACQRGA
mmetsp:Transcript_17288/g.39891  ORF Transcript_17288/g.39891 Transcript_17288/m.39891 type:complete len:223 (-) Transcript_17288:3191-3859(-)